MRARTLLWTATLSLAAMSCQSKKAPAPEAEAAQDSAALPETETIQSCVGPITGGDTPRTITLGKSIWELDGSTLRWVSGPQEETLVIGVLTDIKEASSENLANLRALVDWFRQHKVDMVLDAGDTGESAPEIVKALSVVAELGVPVATIIGNREGIAAYSDALDELKKAHPNVFDLRLVRRIHTPHLDVISLPGYFNPSFIHAADGCQYYPEDVDALSRLVGQSDAPVLLVSHGPPKQSGPEAIDRTSEGANVGDPRLAAATAKLKIPFGLFGNIHEAGGRATTLAGDKRLDEGVFYDALYINPGPTDAVRWQMNDGTESVGMGAVVTIRGKQASYVVRRMPLDGSKK